MMVFQGNVNINVTNEFTHNSAKKKKRRKKNVKDSEETTLLLNKTTFDCTNLDELLSDYLNKKKTEVLKSKAIDKERCESDEMSAERPVVKKGKNKDTLSVSEDTGGMFNEKRKKKKKRDKSTEDIDLDQEHTNDLVGQHKKKKIKKEETAHENSSFMTEDQNDCNQIKQKKRKKNKHNEHFEGSTESPLKKHKEKKIEQENLEEQGNNSFEISEINNYKKKKKKKGALNETSEDIIPETLDTAQEINFIIDHKKQKRKKKKKFLNLCDDSEHNAETEEQGHCEISHKKKKKLNDSIEDVEANNIVQEINSFDFKKQKRKKTTCDEVETKVENLEGQESINENFFETNESCKKKKKKKGLLNNASSEDAEAKDTIQVINPKKQKRKKTTCDEIEPKLENLEEQESINENSFEMSESCKKNKKIKSSISDENNADITKVSPKIHNKKNNSYEGNTSDNLTVPEVPDKKKKKESHNFLENKNLINNLANRPETSNNSNVEDKNKKEKQQESNGNENRSNKDKNKKSVEEMLDEMFKKEEQENIHENPNKKSNHSEKNRLKQNENAIRKKIKKYQPNDSENVNVKLEEEIENLSEEEIDIEDEIKVYTVDENKNKENTNSSDILDELLEESENKVIVKEQQLMKMDSISVTLPWPVPPLHTIGTSAIKKPSAKDMEKAAALDVEIKMGIFSKAEDEQIKSNWKEFCQLHDLPNDPSPFITLKHKALSSVDKINFLRFLAHKLNNRLVYTVYNRFRRLYHSSKLKNGRFTTKEDEIIKEFMKTKAKKSIFPFKDLAKVLNRDRLAIEKRYMILSQKQNVITWDDDLTVTFIKHLMQVTRTSQVEELQNRKITSKEWKTLSEKIDIPVKKLQEAWNSRISSRIFIKETVFTKFIKEKLIDMLLDTEADDWRNIKWNEIASNFDGMTGAQLNKLLKLSVHYHVPKSMHKDLKACLYHLKKEGFHGQWVHKLEIPNEILEEISNYHPEIEIPKTKVWIKEEQNFVLSTKNK